jgi:hypothetical protein
MTQVPNWLNLLIMLAGFATGGLVFLGLKKFAKSVPYWVVLVVYEGILLGDSISGEKRTQHLFYLMGDGLRGSISSAKRFFTQAGAKAAAAELALSGTTAYLSHSSFRFVEIRIVRTNGL